MGRKPKTETTASVEISAADLTARQIARRKTAATALLIEPHTDNDGFISFTKDGETLHIHLGDFSEPLANAVEKIKTDRAKAEAETRAQLALLLETPDGKKIAAELIAGNQLDGE